MTGAPGYYSQPIELGFGYSVHFFQGGTRLECAWSPSEPKGALARKLAGPFSQAVRAWLGEMEREIGRPIVVVSMRSENTGEHYARPDDAGVVR